jgi:hypothetical protein
MSLDYSTDDRSSIKEATRGKPGVESKRWSIKAPCGNWRRVAHRKDLQEVASWTGSHVMRNTPSELSKQKGCSDGFVWNYVAGKAARFLGISVALISSGCNSPDRVLDIPAAVNTAPKSIEAIKDYQEALSAIVSVMVRELKLPAPQGRLYFYRDAGAYQAALAAELKARGWPEGESKEIRQLRHKLEFELFKFTLNVVTETGALTIDQKVFIAEWSMMRFPWTNRVKILAHELTHVIQSSLSVGRSELTHRWLGEGFAEWVSFKVVDALGAKDFFNDQMREACRHKIANFREIENVESWGRLDRQTRYGQSACAVHYMVVRDGLPAIIEYFRLFKDRFDAAHNFLTAFGKSTDTFEQELRAQVKSTRDFIPFN